MRSYRYVVCDVFTDRPLEGNQLAVFTDARDVPEELEARIDESLGFPTHDPHGDPIPGADLRWPPEGERPPNR